MLRKRDQDDQYQQHDDGKWECSCKNVVETDSVIVQRRLYYVAGNAQRWRQQADFRANNCDDPEPDQVDAERHDDRQKQRHHDQNNRGCVENRAENN